MSKVRLFDTICTFVGLTIVAFSGAPWWVGVVAGAMSVISYASGMKRAEEILRK
jgi:hypothetical protein